MRNFALFAALALALCGLWSLVPHNALAAESGSAKSSAPASAGQQLGQKVIDSLRAARPSLPIERVESTPVEGVVAVHLAEGSVLYGTEDGRYLFDGDLYELSSKGIVNLAEQRRTVDRRGLMESKVAGEALVFAASGTRKAAITVFTDVDCGYCRKLHNEVPQLNAMGIEVRYLAYPRAGIGSESYRKIVSAYCAKDPNSALTKLKAGEEIPNLQCNDNPVADQFELGQRIGISGTPAIVFEDGQLLPGYLPAAELAQRLGL